MEQAIVQRLPKIGEILSVSVRAARSNMGAFARVILPYIAVFAVQNILQTLWPTNPVAMVINVILFIALIAISIWMGILLSRVSYQATMSGKADLAAAQKDWTKVIWPMVVVSILTNIIIMIGLIILIVPGIILALMYFSAPYLAVIDNKKIGESLSQSIQLSKGHKWDLFVKLLVSSAVIGIPSLIVIWVVIFALTELGTLFSPTAGQVLGVIGALLIMIPIIPLFTNVETYLFGHLKKLAGVQIASSSNSSQ